MNHHRRWWSEKIDRLPSSASSFLQSRSSHRAPWARQKPAHPSEKNTGSHLHVSPTMALVWISSFTTQFNQSPWRRDQGFKYRLTSLGTHWRSSHPSCMVSNLLFSLQFMRCDKITVLTHITDSIIRLCIYIYIFIYHLTYILTYRLLLSKQQTQWRRFRSGITKELCAQHWGQR